MKRNVILLTGAASLLSLSLLFSSCNSKEKEVVATPVDTTATEIANDQILTSTVLTKADQDKLTPQDVLNSLKKGNEEFTSDNLTVRNNSVRVREASLGQFPKVAILSCLDSRVPVEDVFHLGIGDAFVGRVAGNIANDDLIGSLEFATKVSGAKLIVVLGHEHCGAVMAAIDGVELGNITGLLNKIKPAVDGAKVKFDGDKTSANPAFVEAVCDHNVELAINQIRTKSPIIKEMESKGEVKIVGGVYDMTTGKVSFME
ncbi:carbonic anhydrase family protein [Dysgonomonas sp. ZJ279]|uniref:carbonic anhydrase family protein n=1 Tax=Dysgonomonas sp. ZJ279 TaxID=2709796 RepID=UPI0013EB5F03|nr:carbonic anhydrase family protein [Dysgonomonas sp. ZJ279]